MSELEHVAGVEPGDILAGKYQVDKVLGAGGMGVVVQATHTVLHDRVALKFLLPELLENESVTQRFLREAQAAVRIKSPNVARVIDVGKLENGAPYMVMEFLEGRDLSHVLADKGALDEKTACGFGMQVCAALAAAHVAGIIHRDIKPGNLFLTHEGDGTPQVKVLDFGISKVTDAEAQRSNLTRTHTAMGSPTYMSPEQMRSSKDVDARTDIWSLGVVVYELLTGRLPYEAASLPELIALVLEKDPPRLRTLRPDLSEDLEAAVGKCLCRSLDGRFKDVSEVARALAPHAGAGGHELAAKVRRILHPELTEPPVDSVPAATAGFDATVSVTAGGSSTNTSFGRTNPGPRSSRKTAFIAGGIGLAAIAAAGLVWVVARPEHHTGGVVQSSASAMAPVSSAEMVNQVSSAAPSSSAQPAASSVASAAPEAGPAATAHDGKGTRTTVTVPVKTGKGKRTTSVFDERQ